MNAIPTCNTLVRVRFGSNPQLPRRYGSRRTIALALPASESEAQGNIVPGPWSGHLGSTLSLLRHGSSSAGNDHFRRGIRLSLFTPYNRLPPDGKIIPDREQMCDSMISNCKTPTYVYEERCEICCGTGHARESGLGRKQSRHGHSHLKLAVCVMCQGLGYVRCTSTHLPEAILAARDFSQCTMMRNFKPEAELAPP